MNWRLLQTIIILPGSAVVFIPVIILWIARGTKLAARFAEPSQVQFWLALAAEFVGLFLCIWTVTLFMGFGDGTPAPWDPPKKLVIRGPYRHVRNPMITGVLLILLAETLLFQSLPLAVWMVFSFLGNAIYFPLVEEKGLEKRFGEDYRVYRANVPRWMPRLRAWSGEE